MFMFKKKYILFNINSFSGFVLMACSRIAEFSSLDFHTSILPNSSLKCFSVSQCQCDSFLPFNCIESRKRRLQAAT